MLERKCRINHFIVRLSQHLSINWIHLILTAPHSSVWLIGFGEYNVQTIVHNVHRNRISCRKNHVKPGVRERKKMNESNRKRMNELTNNSITSFTSVVRVCVCAYRYHSKFVQKFLHLTLNHPEFNRLAHMH